MENKREPWILRDDITVKVDGGGIAFSLDTMHRQQVIMQRVTGTLNPGGHPGSYNGQDAYNDMLISDESIKRRKWATAPDGNDGGMQHTGHHARCTGHSDGGVEK